jgi:hypothetical protein
MVVGWSPRGRRLLLGHGAGHTRVLHTVDRRGRRLRRLRFGGVDAEWTADGRVAGLKHTALGYWRIVARRENGRRRSARALPVPALDARFYRHFALQPVRR